MKFSLIHANHLGQVHTEHGNPRRRDSTSRARLEFDTLEEARAHAKRYVERYPELQCEIAGEDGEREIVVDAPAQAEYLRAYGRIPPGQRALDIVLPVVMLASLLLNVVLAVLLWRGSP